MLRCVLMVALFCGGRSSRFTRILQHQTQPKPWDQARDQCRSEGGDLVTLWSQDDLLQLDLRDFYAWFGLKQRGGDWDWEDGVNIEEADSNEVFIQDQPEPGEKCGMVRFDHNRAYGEHCSQEHFVFCEIYSNGEWHYPFFPEAKSWSQGLDLCRDQGLTYMDFIYDGEFDRLDLPFYEPRDFPLWTGLHHDGGSWRWSDGSESGFRAWSGSEPGSSGGVCVAVSSQSGLMSVHSCSEAFPFLCSRQNYSLELQLQELSWEEAGEHCRDLSSSFRLLSVDSDLQKVLSYCTSATTAKVWVGLRFLAGSWFWLDGEAVTPPLSCPAVTLGCGALVLSSASIEPSDCGEKLNFLCYSEL